MKQWQIITLIGNIAFLISGSLPAVSILSFSISFFDMFIWDLITPAVIIGGILFTSTILAGFASTARASSKLSMTAGTLGLLYWLGVYFAIVQIKSLNLQNPILSTAINQIQIGSGIYVGIVGASLQIVSYFIAQKETKTTKNTIS